MNFRIIAYPIIRSIWLASLGLVFVAILLGGIRSDFLRLILEIKVSALQLSLPQANRSTSCMTNKGSVVEFVSGETASLSTRGEVLSCGSFGLFVPTGSLDVPRLVFYGTLIPLIEVDVSSVSDFRILAPLDKSTRIGLIYAGTLLGVELSPGSSLSISKMILQVQSKNISRILIEPFRSNGRATPIRLEVLSGEMVAFHSELGISVGFSDRTALNLAPISQDWFIGPQILSAKMK